MAIDYGPFLQSQALNQQALSPAMQNMALMTAMFKDVAVPLMQMSMQRDQLALTQQNAVAQMDIQRAQIAMQGNRIEADKEIALGQLVLEDKKQGHAVQLAGMNLAHQFALLEAGNAKDIALQDRRERHDETVLDREMQNREYLEGLAHDRSLREIEIQKQRADNEEKGLKLQYYQPLLTAAQARLDNAEATKNIAGMERYGKEVKQLKAQIGEIAGVSLPTSVAELTAKKNQLKDPVFREKALGSDLSILRTANVLNGALPEQIMENGLGYEMQNVNMMLATRQVKMLSNINIPMLSNTATGLDAVWTMPDAKNKQIPIKGTTFKNAIGLAQQKPEVWRAVKDDALKKATTEPEKANLRVFFDQVEGAAPTDFDDWMTNPAVPDPYAAGTGTGLNGRSAAGAVPAAAAEEVGFLDRSLLGSAAKGIMAIPAAGVGALGSLVMSPREAFKRSLGTWKEANAGIDILTDGKPISGVSREPAALKVSKRQEGIASLKMLYAQMIAAGEDPADDPEFVRMWGELGQPKL